MRAGINKLYHPSGVNAHRHKTNVARLPNFVIFGYRKREIKLIFILGCLNLSALSLYRRGDLRLWQWTVNPSI